MKTKVDQRISLLEQRVAFLEKTLYQLQQRNEETLRGYPYEDYRGEQKQSNESSSNVLFPYLGTNETVYQMSEENVSHEYSPSYQTQRNEQGTVHEHFAQQNHSSNRQESKKNVLFSLKSNEALIGKYIIGALAALLLFVAATSFVMLVWNKITPEVKLSVLVFIALALTTAGFALTKRSKNAISSLVLGTGAGLLYISIISANLAFHMIGSNLTIVLCTVWALFFIFSSYRTNLFFTIVIAYIGSYITLLLGLTLANTQMDLVVMAIFVTGICSTILYMAYRNGKNHYFVCLMFSMFSYSTLFIFCHSGSYGILNREFGNLLGFEGFLILMMYVLLYFLYYEVEKDVLNNTKTLVKRMDLALVISFVVTLFTVLYVSSFQTYYKNITILFVLWTLLAINFIQFVVVNVWFEKMQDVLSKYYVVFILFAWMGINVKLFNTDMGIVLIVGLLLGREKVWNRQENVLWLTTILVVDCILGCLQTEDRFINLIYILLDIGTLIYLAKCKILEADRKQQTVFKKMGIIVLSVSVWNMVILLLQSISTNNLTIQFEQAVGYVMEVLLLLLLIKLGYFKDWSNSQFQFLGNNEEVAEDATMDTVLYLLTTLWYFYGFLHMDADTMAITVVFILFTLISALLQSYIILRRRDKNIFYAGIWIGIKYLLWVWNSLYCVWSLNVESMAYNISGLVIAMAAIWIGLKLALKGLRQYGLILTMLIVAKFILVDLNRENSITRIGALIAGALLCFGISWIYNKLSEKYS